METIEKINYTTTKDGDFMFDAVEGAYSVVNANALRTYIDGKTIEKETKSEFNDETIIVEFLPDKEDGYSKWKALKGKVFNLELKSVANELQNSTDEVLFTGTASLQKVSLVADASSPIKVRLLFGLHGEASL